MNKSTLTCTIVLFSCLLLFVSFRPFTTDNKIFWKKDYKLTWDDFTASPDRNSDDAAITASGFLTAPYTIWSDSDSVSLTVHSYFNKSASWVKANAKKEAILKHEQCHFDITELYVRKFRKKLTGIQFNRDSFKPTLLKLLESTRKEWDDYQNLYDHETDHSKNAKEQQIWEKKVEKELNSLEAFAGSTVMLYLKPVNGKNLR